MKKVILLLLFSAVCLGQNPYRNADGGLFGASTNTLAPSAILEGRSTTKGFLPPGGTSAQMNAIPSPATGLIVKNMSDSGKPYYFNGTNWVAFGGGSVPTLQQVYTVGNTIVSGTDSFTLQPNGLNFISTNSNTNLNADNLSINNNATGKQSEFNDNSIIFQTATSGVSIKTDNVTSTYTAQMPNYSTPQTFAMKSYVDAAVSGATPSIPSTQIAFGDASNLLTSSDNFVFSNGNFKVIGPAAEGLFLGKPGSNIGGAATFGGLYSGNTDQIIADFNPTTNVYRYANGNIVNDATAQTINLIAANGVQVNGVAIDQPVSIAEKATWNGKQDALVSGTNIRTVNGESLLGSTDLVIAGGSGLNPTGADVGATVQSQSFTNGVITNAIYNSLGEKMVSSTISGFYQFGDVDGVVGNAKISVNAVNDRINLLAANVFVNGNNVLTTANTTNDLTDSTNKRYVTDSQILLIDSVPSLQPLDSDLTAIAGLTPTNDDILQRKLGVWTNRTTSQYKSDLALTKADVGLSNVDNTSDNTKNSATATLINKTLTAPVINSPTGIVKADVGLSNVDNISDANKPISTAQQTALDLKQNTLVSGVNIKTINGNTILGSGNLTIASGTGTVTSVSVVTANGVTGSVDNATIAPAITFSLGAITPTTVVASGAMSASNFSGSSSGTNTGDNAVNSLYSGLAASKLNVSSNGSDISDIKAFRANLGVDKITLVGNANYTVLSTDKVVGLNASITAPRTFTLPLASSVNAGYELIIADLTSSVNLTNTLTIVCAAGENINGGASQVIAAPYGMRRLISNGITKWNFDGGVMRISDYIGTTLTPSKVLVTDVNSKIAPSSITTTELGYLSGVTSAIQTQIILKANINSPTLTGTVTIPSGAILGVPASLIATNVTGLPISTGVSGLGTGVATFLATPSSANLAAALTDKTGTGSSVFNNTPTIITPTISTINGGTAANDDITIQGTTSATKTSSYVLLQPTGGNVGIGTVTPSATLDIRSGTAASAWVIGGASSGSYAQMVFGQSTSTGGYAEFYRESNASSRAGQFIISNFNKSILLSTSNSGGYRSDFLLNSSGNVSLGSANDTYKLDVSGTGRFTGTVVVSDATLSTEAVNKGQLDAGYVTQGVNNTTTVALSNASLVSTYPTATPGFRVYATSIVAGAMVYEKTPTTWIGTTVFVVP